MSTLKPQKIISRCLALWQKHFAVRPMNAALPDIARWFEGNLGEALLIDEKEQLDEVLPCLFGYHLMQLSVIPELNLSTQSKINHQFALSPVMPEKQQSEGDRYRVSAVSDFETLPLPGESLDLAILHHALEFSEKPHQLLRETAKCIIPHGYVIIVGFNPFSFFGVTKITKRLFCLHPFWRQHTLRKGRIIDWLHLLDFEVVDVKQGFYRFPVDHAGLLKKTTFLERWGQRLMPWLGGFYLVVARKEVAAMTPLNPSWKKAPMGILPVGRALSKYSAGCRHTGT